MIVICPLCGASITAPDNAAGKKARCPKCNEVIDIKAPEPASPSPTPPVRARARTSNWSCPYCQDESGPVWVRDSNPLSLLIGIAVFCFGMWRVGVYLADGIDRGVIHEVSLFIWGALLLVPVVLLAWFIEWRLRLRRQACPECKMRFN